MREIATITNNCIDEKIDRSASRRQLSFQVCNVQRRGLGHLRQKNREQPDRRQEGADLIDEARCRYGRRHLPSTAAPRPPMPNATPKNTPEIIPNRCGISSCANTMIDDVVEDRMRPMNTVSTAPANRFDIRQRQRERQRAEDRKPDHIFAAEAVAERTTEQARRSRWRPGTRTSIDLRGLGRNPELVDQIEHVVARQARNIELLREQQRHQHDRARSITRRESGASGCGTDLGMNFLAAICGRYQQPDPPQDDDRQKCDRGKPGDAGLAERHHDQGRQHRPHRRCRGCRRPGTPIARSRSARPTPTARSAPTRGGTPPSRVRPALPRSG